MAEEMFSRADLEYIYRDIFGHEGASKKDVEKLMAKLPSKFTLAQLRSAVQGAGFGDKATRRFSQVVGYIDDAVAAPAATTTTSTGQQGSTTNAPASSTYGDRQGDKIRISDYLPDQGPIGDYLTNLFLGGGNQQRGGGGQQMFGGPNTSMIPQMGGGGGSINDIMNMIRGGAMSMAPPDWQPPKGAARSSYDSANVPGLKWNGQSWQEVQSGADLTYDGQSGKYFYKGYEVPANQQADMYKYGPGMGKTTGPSLANDMIDLSDPRVRAMFPAQGIMGGMFGGGGGQGGAGSINDILNAIRGGASGGQQGGMFGGGGGQGGPWENAPFSAPTSFAENYIQQLLTNYQPTGPSQLEQQITNMAMRGPQGLTPDASQFEGMLANYAQNPYLQSIASGQIPPAMQQALNNQLRVSQANTLEGMGAGQGQLSSDLAQYLNRTESDARTQFLANMAGQAADVQSMLANIAGTGGGLYNQRQGIGAQLFPSLVNAGLGAEQNRRGNDLQYLLGLTNPLLSTQASQNENALNRFLGVAENAANRGFNREENALSRYMGLANMLFGSETGQRQNALNYMLQDYMGGKGLPPEISALLGLAGLGGGTTKTTGSQSQSGGGFGDLLGALGGLGGLALTGGMGGLGGLFGGLFGGGKTP